VEVPEQGFPTKISEGGLSNETSRADPNGALIKQINIVFFNANSFAVNATLYVFDATGAAQAAVGNLPLYRHHH
jgi:hypothetical protein